MNWKISLDRYLTTPPDDGYDGWLGVLYENITDDFYYLNEGWLLGNVDDQCDRWLEKLFRKGIDPAVGARIVERAFKLYL